MTRGRKCFPRLPKEAEDAHHSLPEEDEAGEAEDACDENRVQHPAKPGASVHPVVLVFVDLSGVRLSKRGEVLDLGVKTLAFRGILPPLETLLRHLLADIFRVHARKYVYAEVGFARLNSLGVNALPSELSEALFLGDWRRDPRGYFRSRKERHARNEGDERSHSSISTARSERAKGAWRLWSELQKDYVTKKRLEQPRRFLV